MKPEPKGNIDPADFCFQNQIVGFGWPVDSNIDPLGWDAYLELARKLYRDKHEKPWWSAVNALRNKMKENDLCWTRDKRGTYYLARIEGAWHYTNAGQHLQADVVNTRRVDGQRWEMPQKCRVQY